MNKLSKDKRDRLILVGTITAMVIASLWFMVIGDQHDNLTEKAAKSQKLADSILRAEGVVKMGPEIEKRLNEHMQALQTKESEMAPEDDPYAWMLEVMSRSCQGRQLFWQLDKPEFRQSDLLPNFSYRSAVFHFKGSGTFNVIGRFIADLENTHRMFQIRNLVITPANNMSALRGVSTAASDDDTLSVDFLIVTPVRPVETQASTK